MRVRVADARVLTLAAVSVVLLTPMFVWTARTWRAANDAGTAFVHATTLVVAVLAGYELFFATQRAISRPSRRVRTRWDERIPFRPAWVWVYGALYYVIISFPAGLLTDVRSFLWFIGGGVAMLVLALPVFVLWPTETPPEWRSYEVRGASTRFLRFIQSFDNGRGCIPSLHMAFSVYAATFYPWAASLVLIPLAVGIACVFVKQHSVIDLAPGWLLGTIAGFTIHAML